MSFQPRPLQYPPIFPFDKSLVLDLTFDERSGAKAYDRSGKGNHGTISGATWVTGRRGAALSFNGLNNYVEVAHSTSLNFLSAMTIEMRIKPAVDMYADWVGLIDKRNGGAAFALYYHKTNKYLYLYINGGAVVGSSQRTFYAGTWYHIVATAKSGSLDNHLYINGIEDSPNIGARDFITNTAPVKIGILFNLSLPFSGIIEKVRIYNQALSAAESKQLYESEIMLVQ